MTQIPEKALQAAVEAKPASKIVPANDGCNSIVMRTNEEGARLALEAAIATGELVPRGKTREAFKQLLLKIMYLTETLEVITNIDPVDAALDPDLARRIAKEALSKEGS